MTMHNLTTPLTTEQVVELKTGDKVLLSGVLYTARDAAHARLVEALEIGNELPFDLEGQVIYYVGPTPAPPERVIGSAGPTTSGRMDSFTPALLAAGLKAMIGKGARSAEVREAIAARGAVYLGATGGAAALLANSVVSCEVVAYPELGCEAVHRLVVKDMPLVVINDSFGGDLYEQNREKYAKTPPSP